ncbi:hypothetical protein GCM10011376_35200 [Nocardioides flavus (ex Wang et al. 2016)]|uniref:Dolichyl-phosphate-mannose-protein mannosyltransferase n=1 Tax=Nocardioides flavus (ex Wang et al. 2016) TaxID=2058780 RepID=A0ABQ3HQ71_9ACTN|nr:hypothetical protein [Nocardioides flavus (ex Wang et al. 2016)]GHE18910.1 hypothetical protein GCM10011376_35200 [Nocardioides flavus (ex Wang et al. 2016)]
MSADLLAPSIRPGTPPPARPPRGWDRPAVIGVGIAAALAVAAWLPFLGVPLSPDESGFLLLAQHWRPGSSLYGNYWVDRPPLLLWLFSVAGHLGPVGHPATGVTAPGVRLLGAAASGLTVVLAGVVAQLVAPTQRWTRRVTVVAALALLSSPLLGMPVTNGELLALPFVLLGTACLIAAARRNWGRDAGLLTVAAGASGVGAALVKQNVIDVFVFAAVLLVAAGGNLSHRWRRVGTFLTTAAGVLAASVLVAAARGTTPAGLWDATVVFRLQASAVIHASASSATAGRMGNLALAAVGSGVLVLGIAAAVGAVLGRPRYQAGSARARGGAPVEPQIAVTWAALGMVLWEVCGVALGGSYWLHYLTGLVPGVLLLVALVRPSRRWRRVLTACVSYLVVASAVVWGHQAISPVTISDDARVVAYLRAHAESADGVVVAFGHPDIVAGSGLSSPYEYLWSLPVRVRDPELTELGAVMTGPDAPRWVVVAGDSVDSWGLHAGATQRLLERHYLEQVAYGDWHVWQHREGGGDR